MNELRDWLQDGDPVANEPPLSDADVQRMRRAIASLASRSPRRSRTGRAARGRPQRWWSRSRLRLA